MKNEEEDDEDTDSIGNLNFKALRDMCRLYGLPRGHVKSTRITRITAHVSTIVPPTVDDEEALFENEEYVKVSADVVS